MASLDADSQFESVRQRMIIRHGVYVATGREWINMKIMVLGEDRWEGVGWGTMRNLRARNYFRARPV